MPQNPLESLKRYKFLGLTPRDLDPVDLEGAWEFVCLQTNCPINWCSWFDTTLWSLCVMLWFVIINIYLVFLHVSGTEFLKLLEFPVSTAINMSLVWMRWLLEAPKDLGWLPEEPITWLEGWNFYLPSAPISLPPPPTFWEGRGDEDGFDSPMAND